MIASLLKTSALWVQSPAAAVGVSCVLINTILAGAVLYILLRPRNKINVARPSHQFSKDGPDVIIIGSGVAGSAMATVLARDGRRVTVLERDLKEPDRIVGELLQPGGVRALTKLGLEDCICDLDAHPILGYVVQNVETQKDVIVPYPKANKEAKDPQQSISPGIAFRHGKFIMALREKAHQEPNVTYIEGSACKLLEENGVVIGVQYRSKGEDQPKAIYAPLTFAMDGCFSTIRKQLVSEPVQTSSHFIGLLMNHCPEIKPNHAELILANPSPILVYQISSVCTRVLVDVRGGLPKDMKDYLLNSVCPQMPERIKEYFTESVVNGRVRSMPNSFLPPSAVERPGVVILGDAYNMRHALTGGGMAVCLNDVILWRKALQGIPDFTDYDAVLRSLQTFLTQRQIEHSFVANVLAQALYEVFASSNKYLICMKMACFHYFGLGGERVESLVKLLAILNPKPLILIGHFLAVTLIAVYHTFQAEPLWAFHRVVHRSAMIVYTASGLLLPLVWSELKMVIKR